MQQTTPYKDRSWLVILLAALMTFLPLLAIVGSLLGYTGGVFMYPLDDTFIHMELARNLAQHGTWGINPGEFGSASSSLLYTIILAAGFKISPDLVLIPLIVNCIAAVLLIVAVQRWMHKKRLGLFTQLAVFFLLVILVPLPTLILSGMEHTLQCLFSFLFLFGLAGWMEKQKQEQNRPPLPWTLPVLGMLVCSIRYEGLFLVGVACLLLLYFKKWRPALTIGFASLAPMILFGLYSVSKGGFFIPNSVLVKSEGAGLSVSGLPGFVAGVLIDKLTTSKTITTLATQRLLIILPLVYFMFCRPFPASFASRFTVVALSLVSLLHLAFASTGWFYRYEAYLVLCATLVIADLFSKYGMTVLRQYRLTAVLLALLAAFFLFFPFVLRSSAAFTKAKQACINIFEQQYQMGQFLKRYYPDTVFAANDIGAVSFYTRGKVVDLWGLATTEVARSRRQNYWNAAFLDSFSRSRGTALAIVYDSWFDSSLLNRWQKLATWQIRNNVICGDDIVSFYVLDPALAPQLKGHLQSFQQKLPATITVKYY